MQCFKVVSRFIEISLLNHKSSNRKRNKKKPFFHCRITILLINEWNNNPHTYLYFIRERKSFIDM